MASEFFYVLLTVIALDSAPARDGQPAIAAGDVLDSTLIGAAETQDKCMTGGRILAKPIEAAGEGSVKVVVSCIELPAHIGVAQGFSDIEDVPLKQE